MHPKISMATLVVTLVLLVASVGLAQQRESGSSPVALRRRYRSNVPEAVRRRLSTVTTEEQLIKDLGDVLSHGRTAVIRFYAEWCPVCQSDRPRFLDLIDNYPNTNFFRVDVDEHPKLSAEYGIRAVPTYFVLQRNVAHLTYHGAGDVANYLTQLKQTRQRRFQQYHSRRS